LSREYPDRPWVGVGVIVWKDNRVLLVRRARPPEVGAWSLPGGAQELGESLFDAALREVAEETGLVVKPVAVVSAFDKIVRDPAGRVQFHYTLVDVAASWVSGEAAAEDDIDDTCWADAALLARMELHADVRQVIEQSRRLLQELLPPLP
jgi:ADP-ribose pyrophosphatase YjhB (NUDIX family)